MRGGVRLGRIFGVEVVVDGSWLVIAVLVAVSFYGELADSGTASVGLVILVALLGAALFFGSVLAHELSHSLVAIRRGIPVRRIRLFIFGGVSEIEHEAATPGDELAITVAGPLTSFLLGGVFFLAWAALLITTGELRRMMGLLAFINLALGVFNLLPGFPLDGGRVLRSLVWRSTGDYRKATMTAVTGGRVLAAILVGIGALALVLGDVLGLWYVAIGWFLFQAAGSSVTRLKAQERLAGVTAQQVMTPVTAAVPVTAALAELGREQTAGRGVAPRVVVADGRVRGLVGAASLRKVPRREWETRQVGEVMQPLLGPGDVLAADELVEPAIPRLAEREAGLAVVSEGRVVGVISLREVERFFRA